MAMAAVPLLAGGLTAGAGTLATIATVGSIGMSLYSGYQSMQAGRAEAGMFKEQSRQYNQQALMEGMRAQQEESNRQVKLNEILNTQMAQFAGRGVQLGGGSDIAISDFSIEEARREGEMASMDSRQRQINLRGQAQQARGQASQARAAGMAGLISGIASAAQTGYGAYTKSQERKLTSPDKGPRTTSSKYGTITWDTDRQGNKY